MSFTIDPQLLADTHQLGRLTHCHILLHRNAAVPWFILVPETDQIELVDLPRDVCQAVLNECRAVAGILRSEFPVTKLNIAALGNVVPQLHLHVIGRHADDPCWPKPVWGNLPSVAEYSSEVIERLRQLLAIDYPDHC